MSVFYTYFDQGPQPTDRPVSGSPVLPSFLGGSGGGYPLSLYQRMQMAESAVRDQYFKKLNQARTQNGMDAIDPSSKQGVAEWAKHKSKVKKANDAISKNNAKVIAKNSESYGPKHLGGMLGLGRNAQDVNSSLDNIKNYANATGKYMLDVTKIGYAGPRYSQQEKIDAIQKEQTWNQKMNPDKSAFNLPGAWYPPKPVAPTAPSAAPASSNQPTTTPPTATPAPYNTSQAPIGSTWGQQSPIQTANDLASNIINSLPGNTPPNVASNILAATQNAMGNSGPQFPTGDSAPYATPPGTTPNAYQAGAGLQGGGAGGGGGNQAPIFDALEQLRKLQAMVPLSYEDGTGGATGPGAPITPGEFLAGLFQVPTEQRPPVGYAPGVDPNSGRLRWA